MTADRLQLEQEIVYAAINSPGDFVRVSRGLMPEMFSAPTERRVIEVLHRFVADGIEINWINVQNELQERVAPPESFEIGFADLSIASKRLAEMVILEKRTELAHRLIEEDDPFVIIKDVNNVSNDYAAILVAHSRTPKTKILTLYLEMLEANQEGKILHVPTGFPTLDRWTHGGVKLGNITFLGGSPGAGKTAMTLKMAMNAASRGYQTTFIEGEMPVVEILSILNGQDCKLPVHEIESGRHMAEAAQFAEKMRFLQFDVESTFERNVPSLMSRIQQAAKDGSQLIFVDYLQVFVDKNGRAQDEFAKIKALSEGIRKLTLLNNIHIVAISSLNRIDHNQPKLTLNSFYGGSQLGHDCNAAIILSWDDEEELGEAKNRTVVAEVVKNRGGRCGPFKINFELETQNMTEQSDIQVQGRLDFHEPEEQEPF